MLTIATLLMTMAVSPQAMKPGPDHCDTTNRTVSAPGMATPRKLGEEPPASQIYAV